MRPIRVTVGAVAVSNAIPLDQYISPFNVGFGVSLSAGATLTYKVEHTFADIWSPTFDPATANWFTHDNFVSGKTVSFTGSYTSPVTAIRLNVTEYTSGTATMTAVQAGVANG